ncbi:DnaD domain-containing protein [Saccharibacillus kuerlensis]|uniref:DNA replication protein DnaD n=1 Tax=Saccharibacillus kuerlensis TaxID=459527 RepID=A0ABQ2L5B5_9BACL|nr:DnaD domain-containing protein [Saccharibacillus kuerlensis]GGO04180.1 DNA replication protein DnaD [Saccharibacillus kuerlensis]
MNDEAWKTWSMGVSYAMESPQVHIPHALLRFYRKMDLSLEEAMLLIQLIAFRQAELNDFPTLEELQERTGMEPSELAARLQRLIKDGFLAIHEDEDTPSGIRFERYNLAGLYERLAGCLAEERRSQRRMERPAAVPEDDTETADNLFGVFEQEFARPLSPMECETISVWIDQDRYPEELILLALKEAVFAGKLHFRYIDRILLEWSRNRVRTPEDVRAYSQKFRGQR